MKKAAFLILGTKNYIDLALNCAKSIFANCKLDGVEIDCIIFTDHNCNLNHPNITTVNITHMPWPLITLFRYHFFKDKKFLLKHYDYLYYIDADMRMVAPVGNEILGTHVRVIHPGFYNVPKEYWTYERNTKSTACVKHYEGKHYYIGAFQGGEADEFLLMCEVLEGKINQDLKVNHIAVWHDESHMNRYALDNVPDVSLSPSYCYPEHHNLPFEPKIMAIAKDQNVIRSE